ncbi:magnesium/cobalt transporter CorA [Flavobacterium litorale]|uniref:Magnesium transport protein CorA n=1 Tax=Flavobacterium litorale TaxID=2856519 RepID=A0ABX8VAA3_9FLAO|nr:magnesium/cobalt transporter CorA [Flavobacterium litorale]QYJ67971.1 magnesium/cobalt transporter CorA [Flavobacterium litorale]
MKRIKYRKVRKVQPNYFEYTGNHTTEPVAMQLFAYNEHNFTEYDAITPETIAEKCDTEKYANDVLWLNIHGLHDVELIKCIGKAFQLENFIIDEILNTSQRTRMNELEDILFFSVKSILPEEELGTMETEQISFVLKGNVIISFQEKRSDYFDHIRERIRTGTGLVRKRKNDFALYLMLDAIMENFFVTIEKQEEEIETISTKAKNNYKADIIAETEKVRENLNYLKWSLYPLKEALFDLKDVEANEVYEAIRKSSYAYFGRLHQKSLEMLDQIEHDLTSLESISNFHYSAQSQRMNEIMKTLTIFSVIFMPITFIVGVYGMNFENMPELRAANGYYIVMGVMLVVTIGMVFYFKQKDWF